MRLLAVLSTAIALLSATAYANTEKVIFVAPAKSKLPDSKPGIDFINIQSLSAGTLRTSLAVTFTNTTQSKGVDHWYLLRNLHERQRHELRICWSATQPTQFELDVYTISNVFDEPHLIQSLARVVQRSEPRLAHTGKVDGGSSLPETHDSVLFLRIQSTAQYFTSNQSLMQHPPPVNVEIILDPYLGGIFPRTLLPTAVYLITITFLGWLAAQIVWNYLKPASIKAHND